MEEGEGEERAAAPIWATAAVFLPDGTAVPLDLGAPPGPAAAELLQRLQGALCPAPPPGPTLSPALALWMGSELLEVQLQPHHRPLRLLRQWPELLLRFSTASPSTIAQDEPCLQLRRNVFFPKSKELELEDEPVLRLLVAEALGQVAGGRCPIDPPEALALAALGCRLRLGPFRAGEHSAHSLRPLLRELLPQAWWGARGGLWGSLWRRAPRPPPPEQQLLDAFSRSPGAEVPPAELCRMILSRCHRLPGYGCAFFPGAIERPPGGLLSRGGLRPVTVAVGLEGVTIIDPREKHVLLSLRYPELCWELVGALGPDGGAQEGPDGGAEAAEPPQLWLEFDGDHEGVPVNRLLRVFSPQAELMCALIDCCIQLGGASEATPPAAEAAPPNADALASGAEASSPKGAAVRRQESVTRPRLQRLRTIDYVQEGQELRRVKPPRRSTSFFSRVGGSYGPVLRGSRTEHG